MKTCRLNLYGKMRKQGRGSHSLEDFTNQFQSLQITLLRKRDDMPQEFRREIGETHL
jgi:hypothetical protein